ncbi:hypothetical protein GCWU000324_02597 [Kingella oralis ATCC 51147]|uniref:Uncharacterized protein n=1 Tax=Kingella oralis ATCC 51147 TaxID=629741 RepID=C4GLM6_9NEIS|nr:hypothetical protein GCWU000324_02597 [Kingella oralis ATCC 51147]
MPSHRANDFPFQAASKHRQPENHIALPRCVDNQQPIGSLKPLVCTPI